MEFFLKLGDARYTLIQRALFLCTVFVSILAVSWRSMPILPAIYATDEYYISYGITLYLALFVMYVLHQIYTITRELELVKKHIALSVNTQSSDLSLLLPTTSFVRAVYDALDRMGGNHYHDEIIEIVQATLSHKVSCVAVHAKTFVYLGLIGTLVGIMAALTGADLVSLFQENANVGAILGAVIGGMKIAIGTSIIGTIAKIWADHLGIILEEATHHLANSIIKMEMLHETSSSVIFQE